MAYRCMDFEIGSLESDKLDSHNVHDKYCSGHSLPPSARPIIRPAFTPIYTKWTIFFCRQLNHFYPIPVYVCKVVTMLLFYHVLHLYISIYMIHCVKYNFRKYTLIIHYYISFSCIYGYMKKTYNDMFFVICFMCFSHGIEMYTFRMFLLEFHYFEYNMPLQIHVKRRYKSHFTIY